MYEAHFGLARKPFTPAPDPRFLVQTETHREALASLLYGIQERKGFIVLTGEVGTGKTLMIRAMLERLGQDVLVAYVVNPRLAFVELLSHVFAEFGIPERPHSKGDGVLILNQWLIQRLAEGKTPVLVLDEGQTLSRDVLEELRLLTNLETSHEKLLHCVLVGQPELEATLADPALRQLVQRVAVHHRIRPLSKAETGEYVRARLRAAGAADGQIFTKRAIRRVHARARGIPRVTNALCDAALILAYASGEREVTHRTIERARPMVAAVCG